MEIPCSTQGNNRGCFGGIPSGLDRSTSNETVKRMPGPIILVDMENIQQIAPAAVPGGARLIVFARNPFLWIS